MVYLDNAATSFPKAPGVSEAMRRYLDEIGGNAGRGSYGSAIQSGMACVRLRRAAGEHFGFSPTANVVITPGQTFALNQCIKGYVHAGDRVVTGALEHNSVARPLRQIGAQVVELPSNRHGELAEGAHAPAAGPSEAYELAHAVITPDTRLVVVSHASNVCGTIMPIEAIARAAAERGVPMVVDAAQTAGHLPIDCAALGLAALCVPGHKGLLGPQGIGLALLAPRFANELEPLVAGGTGSASDSIDQPAFMPDRFESGTLNLPGVFGLLAALEHLGDKTGPLNIASRRAHELQLSARFIEGLAALEGVDPQTLVGQGGARIKLGGVADPTKRVAVFSLDFPGRDNASVSFALEHDHGILTRCGLHCAPGAHRVLGTYPQGSVRFSFGPYTSIDDVDASLAAIEVVVRG